LRSAAIDRAVGILGSAVAEAVTALRSIVNDASQKPSDRIAAARAILSTVAPISELAELRDRVDQLESHHTEARAVA
jgi:hemoglobin-like flavoprotein